VLVVGGYSQTAAPCGGGGVECGSDDSDPYVNVRFYAAQAFAEPLPRETSTRARRALLPVLLDDLGGALARLLRVASRRAQGVALAHEVPQAVELDADLLEPRDVLRLRRIGLPLALAQRQPLLLERVDLLLDLLVGRYGLTLPRSARRDPRLFACPSAHSRTTSG